MARVTPLPQSHSLDDLLDAVEGPPLLLVLDGVTDPHNLGACLRVADGAGVHAVVAPKDHAVGLNATVAKVASGAAETVPYLMVTNLARTLNELKERDILRRRHQRRRADHAVRGRPEGPGGPGAGRRRQGPAPADAQDLRRAGAHPDARRGGEPERLGGQRRVPVRGAAPARGLMTDAAVAAVQALAQRAASVCVLTGAGMSAESGIATFRDAMSGLWSRFDPAELASEEGFRADPARVWAWYAERKQAVRAAQPNAGHVALAEYGRRRPGVLTIVTQNVDDLHQRAGWPQTIRLHGDILADRWLQPCPGGRGLRCREGRTGRAAALRRLRQPAAPGRGLVRRDAARGCDGMRPSRPRAPAS